MLVIQTLPAFAAKLLFPHVGPKVPYYARAFGLSILWGLASFVIYVCPPNVTPTLRVLIVMLASALSAAGDISWLGMLHHYGKPGLAGWAWGTGVGGMLVATMPYVLTVKMGMFLRTSIGYTWYLVPMMLLSHLFVLPQPPGDFQPILKQYKDNEFDVDSEEDESVGMLTRDPPAMPMSLPQQIEANLRLMGQLVGPFMVPLFFGSVGQGIIYPGFSRSMAVTDAVDSYLAYFAVFGLSFQLGNFMSRTAILFLRFRKIKAMLLTLVVISLLLIINGMTLTASSPAIIFSMGLFGGLASGHTYISTFAAALEDNAYNSGADREFSLGVIGAGEAAGLLLGGIMAARLETGFCRMGVGDRWCDKVR